MKVTKVLYLEESDIETWENFCTKNFKTKRVLSKIITEAMEEYIQNFK